MSAITEAVEAIMYYMTGDHTITDENIMYDFLHEELDDYVNVMWNSEIQSILSEFGFVNAVNLWLSEFGNQPLPSERALIYIILKDSWHERYTYEHVQQCILQNSN